MRLVKAFGPYVVAVSMVLAVPAVAAAGDMMSGGPMAGKDSAGMAPAAMAPAPGGVAPAPMAQAGKDSAGMGPAGMMPSSVAPAPARAGGLDPATTAMALSGFGLLTLGGGLALRRRPS
jgi:hypothetical protein